MVIASQKSRMTLKVNGLNIIIKEKKANGLNSKFIVINAYIIKKKGLKQTTCIYTSRN